MAGIPLGSGFNRTSNAPLDLYSVVADQTARNAIGASFRYLGIKVYSIADKKTYTLKNGLLDADWEEDSPVPATAAIYCDKFTATAAQTVFTLSADPIIKDNTLLFIDGVYQEKSTYTLVTTTMTLNEGAVAGAKVQITYGIVAVGSISDNIVSTTKIVDGAVTQAKKAIRGIKTGSGATNPALAGEVGVSASCGLYNHAGGGTPTDVTNLSKTITTLGNPVNIRFVPDGNLSLNDSNIEMQRGSGTAGIGFYVLRDAVVIARGTYVLSDSATGSDQNIPINIFDTIDLPAAGTYVYKLQLYASQTGTTITAKYFKMIVMED